ncbi:MAG TPA: hypothetical protein VF450_13205 [Noviherbaspirillum sp.]
MKNRFPFLLIALAVLSACQQRVAKRYIALKTVPIYREPIDGTEDVIYEVKKGEVCIFGKEVMKKVYMFRGVTCGEVHGWTPGWAAFEEVKCDSAKEGMQ